MNEHKQINELLVDFALGELSQEQASSIQTHLDQCPQCSHEIKHLEALLECTERISKSSVDEQTCNAARRAILQTVEDQKIKQQTSGPIMSLEYIRKTIMKSKISKIAAAAGVVIAVLIGVFLLGGSMEGVAWAKVVENIERTGSFVFQHQISVTTVADGTTIQESETTTYVSSDFGLRQDAYMNDQVIGISYIPPAGTIITQVMPGEKKYRSVTMSEEHMRKTHEQANPMGMIREFMSYEHTQLGREIIDGVEVEALK